MDQGIEVNENRILNEKCDNIVIGERAIKMADT